MNRVHRLVIWLFWLFLMASCEEEEYYYPSVKLEFVTVKAGSDGKIKILIPDKEEQLQVSQDLTNSSISPNSFRRVLSNYERLLASDGKSVSAKIYSLQNILLLEPKLLDDVSFGGVMKADPVDVISIWTGGGYLNLILNLKVKGGKQHVLGIVEEEDTGMSIAKEMITLSLYHNANGDEEYYNRRAFISVPLSKYDFDKAIKVEFKYHTYDKKGQIQESVKYCTYTPSTN